MCKSVSFEGFFFFLRGSFEGFDSWPATDVCCCRYANLRRRLLIDPHLSKDEDGAPNLVVENPLSQNPGG